MFLLSTFSGNIRPSNIPFLQPITLVYPVLLIINILFLFYWSFLKSKTVLLPVVFLLLGISNLWNNFQITLLPSNEDDKISMVTYNVQQFRRQLNNTGTDTKSEIVHFIRKEDPHLLCLQEYHSRNTNLYEPLKQLRDTLNMESYYYESYFNPKYDNLTGLAIFSKFKAVNKGRLKFDGSRTFGIYIDVMLQGDTTRIFNIHLASIRLTPEDLDFVINPESSKTGSFKNTSLDIYHKLVQAYELREKQTDYLVKMIDSCQYRIILAGDFNDTPSSWVYKQIVDKLNDSFKRKGNGFSATYAGPLPYLRIDYIFTNSDFTISDYSRNKLDFSDHYPVSATFSEH